MAWLAGKEDLSVSSHLSFKAYSVASSAVWEVLKELHQ